MLLHFFLLFPFRRDWLNRHPKAAWGLYAPSLVLVALLEARNWPTGLAHALGAAPFLPRDAVEWVHWGEGLVGMYWAASLVGALVLFFHAYRTNRLATVRQRLRIVWLGALASILPLLLVLCLYLIRPQTGVPGDRLATLALVFLPVSFGYAILRQQFVDWEWMVKRSLVYAALAHAAIFVFFGSAFVTRRWAPQWAEADGSIGAAVGLALLVGMLGPISDRLHDRLDRYVYPDRYDIRRPMRDLMRQIRRAHTDSRRERVLLATLGRVLGAQKAAFFRTRGGGWFEASSFLGPRHETLPLLSPALAEPVFVQGEPLLRGDLEAAVAALELPESDLEILQTLRARIFVPLIGPSGRLGLIVPGHAQLRRELHDSGAGVSRGLSDSGEPRPGERHVARGEPGARRASRRDGACADGAARSSAALVAAPRATYSLPRSASRPGKWAATTTTAWWRSAGSGGNGDLSAPLAMGERGELILAIGDVSGKGVPAALLMSNVQAIFHAEADVGRSPEQILQALNARLCSLDRPDRFVSFFCARFDPATRVLEYANAGHLPPVWVGGDGTCRPLEQSGLLLGVRPESEYAGGQAILGSGDVLVLFTDGVTERDGADGAFDESQLARFVAAHRHLAADDLLAHILGRPRRPAGARSCRGRGRRIEWPASGRLSTPWTLQRRWDLGRWIPWR